MCLSGSCRGIQDLCHQISAYVAYLRMRGTPFLSVKLTLRKSGSELIVLFRSSGEMKGNRTSSNTLYSLSTILRFLYVRARTHALVGQHPLHCLMSFSLSTLSHCICVCTRVHARACWSGRAERFENFLSVHHLEIAVFVCVCVRVFVGQYEPKDLPSSGKGPRGSHKPHHQSMKMGRRRRQHKKGNTTMKT